MPYNRPGNNGPGNRPPNNGPGNQGPGNRPGNQGPGNRPGNNAPGQRYFHNQQAKNVAVKNDGPMHRPGARLAPANNSGPTESKSNTEVEPPSCIVISEVMESTKGESNESGGAGKTQEKKGNDLDKPQVNEEPKRPEERKFTQRSRLYCGNLPHGITEDDFKGLFSPYGDISEVFVHSDKGFGFVRLDTRANAEKAKWELDTSLYRNRQLRVRFATSGSALSVKNLSPYVSNELLREAFSMFGEVERAIVVVDDKGRSTLKGIVEFARKSSATKALQQIKEQCFLMTSSPRAISACPLDQTDTEDGLPDKSLPQNAQFFQEREAPPRFAHPGSFEEEFARRWKALDVLETEQRDQLEKSFQASREKLEMEMEIAMQDHQTMLMKQDLMRRQIELERVQQARKREIERRQALELARHEARQKELEEMKQRQDMLRAQIEGTYQAQMAGVGQARAQRGFVRETHEEYARAVSPSGDSQAHTLESQEMNVHGQSRFDSYVSSSNTVEDQAMSQHMGAGGQGNYGMYVNRHPHQRQQHQQQHPYGMEGQGHGEYDDSQTKRRRF